MKDVGKFCGYLVYFYCHFVYITVYGIFYGHLVYFVVILVYNIPVLVCCTKKNLATLKYTSMTAKNPPNYVRMYVWCRIFSPFFRFFHEHVFKPFCIFCIVQSSFLPKWKKCVDRRLENRVTRLGEFSPIWRMLLWAICFETYRSSKYFLAACLHGNSCMSILTIYNALGYVLGDFFKNFIGSPC
jgi:hypothetical protein